MSKRTKARGYHSVRSNEQIKPSVHDLGAFADVLMLSNESDPAEFNVSVLSSQLSERLGCQTPYEALNKWSAMQKFLMKTLHCKTMEALCLRIRREHNIRRFSDNGQQFWTKTEFSVHKKDWVTEVLQQELEPGKREYLPDCKDNISYFPGI